MPRATLIDLGIVRVPTMHMTRRRPSPIRDDEYVAFVEGSASSSGGTRRAGHAIPVNQNPCSKSGAWYKDKHAKRAGVSKHFANCSRVVRKRTPDDHDAQLLT